jgi:hypothetical protein
MQSCHPKSKCCCFHYLSDEQKSRLVSDFEKLALIAKQKQFIHAMLSSSSDDDGYERCFKVDENLYLCREGLCKVLKLQLSRRKEQIIVPSNIVISQRYRLICISAVFSALVLYRTSVMQSPPTRTNNTFIQSVKWASPCFSDAVKKVNRIPAYSGKNGISTFVSHLGITKALKNEQILLGATGDFHLQSFITSVHGCFIDLTIIPGYDSVLHKIYDVVKNLSGRHTWKRVNKISLSHAKGGAIEYTSSSLDSIQSWVTLNDSTTTKNSGNCAKEQYSIHIPAFEKHIKESISNFAFQSPRHVVSLQPGALRSPPGTVPQRAHRDFSQKIYRDKFPGQVYIGFMPVSPDGMFLQVWKGPGTAKLVFIPFGHFLLLPGDAVHAGWMCTSIRHLNYRLHFYIVVSNKPDIMERHESYVFENMNTYIDEESSRKEQFYHHYQNALSNSKNFI